MKFKLFCIFLLIVSCSSNYTTLDKKGPYNSKGFAYIYNEQDYQNKIIKGKLNNSILQVSHKDLRLNTLIKIINPKTKESLVIKNQRRIKYPDFYKILISKPVAEKLSLNNEMPVVEILELKKNKSFIAKKAKIFNEEKKISSNAPVTSVEISNISKNNLSKKKEIKDNIYIIIASFYSRDSAVFLKDRITTKIPNLDQKKLKIVKKSNKKINLISGPYSSINLIKDDYTLLKNFGFEELDIVLRD